MNDLSLKLIYVRIKNVKTKHNKYTHIGIIHIVDENKGFLIK